MHSSGSAPSTTRTVHGTPLVSAIRQMRSICTGSRPERPGSSHSTKSRCVLRSSHATRSNPTDLPIAGGPDRNSGRRIWPPPVGSSSDGFFGEERYSTTASARLSVASRRKQYPRAAAAQSGTPMWARPANPARPPAPSADSRACNWSSSASSMAEPTRRISRQSFAENRTDFRPFRTPTVTMWSSTPKTEFRPAARSADSSVSDAQAAIALVSLSPTKLTSSASASRRLEGAHPNQKVLPGGILRRT